MSSKQIGNDSTKFGAEISRIVAVYSLEETTLAEKFASAGGSVRR